MSSFHALCGLLFHLSVTFTRSTHPLNPLFRMASSLDQCTNALLQQKATQGALNAQLDQRAHHVERHARQALFQVKTLAADCSRKCRELGDVRADSKQLATDLSLAEVRVAANEAMVTEARSAAQGVSAAMADVTSSRADLPTRVVRVLKLLTAAKDCCDASAKREQVAHHLLAVARAAAAVVHVEHFIHPLVLKSEGENWLQQVALGPSRLLERQASLQAAMASQATGHERLEAATLRLSSSRAALAETQAAVAAVHAEVTDLRSRHSIATIQLSDLSHSELPAVRAARDAVALQEQSLLACKETLDAELSHVTTRAAADRAAATTNDAQLEARLAAEQQSLATTRTELERASSAAVEAATWAGRLSTAANEADGVLRRLHDASHFEEAQQNDLAAQLVQAVALRDEAMRTASERHADATRRWFLDAASALDEAEGAMRDSIDLENDKTFRTLKLDAKTSVARCTVSHEESEARHRLTDAALLSFAQWKEVADLEQAARLALATALRTPVLMPPGSEAKPVRSAIGPAVTPATGGAKRGGGTVEAAMATPRADNGPLEMAADRASGHGKKKRPRKQLSPSCGSASPTGPSRPSAPKTAAILEVPSTPAAAARPTDGKSALMGTTPTPTVPCRAPRSGGDDRRVPAPAAQTLDLDDDDDDLPLGDLLQAAETRADPGSSNRGAAAAGPVNAVPSAKDSTPGGGEDSLLSHRRDALMPPPPQSTTAPTKTTTRVLRPAVATSPEADDDHRLSLWQSVPGLQLARNGDTPWADARKRHKMFAEGASTTPGVATPGGACRKSELSDWSIRSAQHGSGGHPPSPSPDPRRPPVAAGWTAVPPAMPPTPAGPCGQRMVNHPNPGQGMSTLCSRIAAGHVPIGAATPSKQLILVDEDDEESNERAATPLPLRSNGPPTGARNGGASGPGVRQPTAKGITAAVSAATRLVNRTNQPAVAPGSRKTLRDGPAHQRPAGALRPAGLNQRVTATAPVTAPDVVATFMDVFSI